MNDMPFSSKTNINRDGIGWTMPVGATSEATKVMLNAVNSFGFLINVYEEISVKDFAKRIKDYSSAEKTSVVHDELLRVESLTGVIFASETRKPDDVIFKYSVVGATLEDAESFLIEVLENKFNKDYKDGVERRLSIYTSKGGELSSGLFTSKKQKTKNKP